MPYSHLLLIRIICRNILRRFFYIFSLISFTSLQHVVSVSLCQGPMANLDWFKKTHLSYFFLRSSLDIQFENISLPSLVLLFRSYQPAYVFLIPLILLLGFSLEFTVFYCVAVTSNCLSNLFWLSSFFAIIMASSTKHIIWIFFSSILSPVRFWFFLRFRTW